MRVFTGSIATETNSFAPIPTGRAAFAEFYYPGGSQTARPGPFGSPLLLVREQCAALGWELVEGLVTFAQPGGLVDRKVYEGLRDQLLGDLRAAGPVDIVFLVLHGAMVADGYPDCEGDILRRVRAITGPDTIIGVELDPHCHLTDAMMQAADLLVCFKEYPHTDIPDRAAELWQLCVAASQKRCRPIMRQFDCRMLNLYYTSLPDMAGFVTRMKQVEKRPGILSVSLVHGFPWADVPDASSKVLVITDDNPDLADAVAEQLGHALIDMRDRTMGIVLDCQQAANAVLAGAARPVVLADGADNPGIGAPGDSTYLIHACLQAGITGLAVAFLWDAAAVQAAMAAGVGAETTLHIGGKACALSGPPLEMRVRVDRIVENAIYGFELGQMPLGDVAVVSGQGITFVLTSLRSQCFSPNAFSDFGVDLDRHPVLLVKSTQHFRAWFAPIAGTILSVAAPGVGTLDFRSLAYQNIQRPIWPLDDIHPPARG